MAGQSTGLDKEISQLSVLRVITRAYAQIASMHIKNVRDGVLESRDYLGEINEVFKDVLNSYREEIERLARKKNAKKGSQLTFLAHNGLIVNVFISANSRLYGDLISKTFQNFITDVKASNAEVTVIGKYGLSLFEAAKLNRPYTYFDFPDTKIDKSLLAKIIAHLVQYEKINFFYPQFQNAVVQKPTKFSMSAGANFDITSKDSSKKTVQYIFEPSLQGVLSFFESQIFSSLLEQAFRESQLAKFASRVISMDRASELVGDQLKKLNTAKLKASHELINKKQMNLLNGMNLWSK